MSLNMARGIKYRQNSKMNVPEQFKHRIFRTRFSGLNIDVMNRNQIQELAPGSEIDVVIESLNGFPIPVVVLVFETPEDCLAFTLKHGHKYAYE